MTTFGEKIEALRVEKSMTRKAVGEALGIPESRMSELERGVRIPDDTQVERLEAFFEVGAGDLAGLVDG
jgi:transcriptional regulator with XRE-family HTH domain